VLRLPNQWPGIAYALSQDGPDPQQVFAKPYLNNGVIVIASSQPNKGSNGCDPGLSHDGVLANLAGWGQSQLEHQRK